ncbi:sensor histidine kinase [Kineothrix sp. MB12-C1]|uniref:sensor histidine kinase n=1 Tax=Kineothrix sp. MB12-C1 TaxID=3070215 RepID=UPI0027D2F84D|nr:HAMP domain-containing sensor histidine kinase [Kineothrix sp. MB12-C1]WMC92671.1 HAMP domain-containing sensor histidine kinase [Kineothrix sp. MB12-C1]
MDYEKGMVVRMKKRIPGKKLKGFLHILQHILIVLAAVVILIVMTGSSVMIKGVDGNYSYSMDADEKGNVYEESFLFNHIFGRGIADVARMVAVRSQMETEGKFDGKKPIDVATFFYRFEGVPSQYITAKYHLEDLIKWGQYGVEKSEEWLTGQEADQFLNRMTTYTHINDNRGDLQGHIITPFNSNIEENTEVYSVSANGLEDSESFYRDDVMATILMNRYKTTEGKNIEEYTGTWNDYYELCEYVEATAIGLKDNYEEYLKYKEFYDLKNSNLRYYIIKTIGERQEIYTNLEVSGLSEKAVTEEFKRYGKYLYFNPADMKYTTDTLVKEETVRHIFNSYEYAYPETIKVWVGVDVSYPASDVYTQGMSGYASYIPYYWQLIGLAAAALLLYLLLFLYLTVVEGRERDEEGNLTIRLQKIDLLPTELSVIGTTVLIGGIIIALTYVYDSMSFEYYYTTWFKVAAGAIVLICELLFAEFYYSMVRRLKADNLWKESLTCKGIRTGRKAVWNVYDNGTVIMKTWVPYIVFLLLNLGLVLLGLKGIIIACMIDIAFGTLIYLNAKNRQHIVMAIEKIREGDLSFKVKEEGLHGDNLVLAQAVNNIGEGIRTAVETSMKDERLKADLITNVSHDIKTPLTSIINYVDLIRRENIENEKVKGYVEVLDAKSQRLKQLTDDLVEASKISSGNISLEWEKINLIELVNQTIGEFSDKFKQKGLTPILNTPGNTMYIEADSRRIWRVVENLLNNIFKYALEGTRIYMDITEKVGEDGKKYVEFAIKNISAQPLNVNADELTERFIRGDVARSTEGSGLGLSIAKNLTQAQNGRFEIQLDGDLFKVILTFPLL